MKTRNHGLINPENLHFLVVEDDEFQRETLVRMLLSMGARKVHEAGDGKQALELLRMQSGPQVDIVLSDLEMPEMDGMEYFRHMGHYFSHVSLIIMSALDSALIASVEEMARAYGIRLLGAVEKPLTRTRLQTLIARHALKALTPERGPASPARFSLEEILSGLRNNEFEPFYQPKVDIASGKIVGVEALARWMHPVHGVIGPAAFIDVLECNSKLDDLTMNILKQAARACRQLHDSGRELSVAVNISLTSLTDTTLANRIIAAVREAGIASRYVILEITETAAMADVAPVLENLARLRMHGFGLSMDDYGTGYSSLQQISRIAFSELKIDQTLVKGLAENEALHIMVQSSIDLAHRLKIKCTAEGVETERDWLTLKTMVCDLAQGYFLGKPMDLLTLLDFCEHFALD